MRHNLITDNDGIGLFIREYSRGVIEKNIVRNPNIFFPFFILKKNKSF